MSFKSSLVKTAIKLTPNIMVEWVANFILKDIAKLTDFNFDLETRCLYVQIQLVGESETIEVWLEDFAIISERESHQFIIHQAKSNRVWLHNLLAKISGKNWKIPAIPQLAAHIELVSELLKAENSEQEEIVD
jgi:hypothetical protein